MFKERLVPLPLTTETRHPKELEFPQESHAERRKLNCGDSFTRGSLSPGKRLTAQAMTRLAEFSTPLALCLNLDLMLVPPNGLKGEAGSVLIFSTWSHQVKLLFMFLTIVSLTVPQRMRG